MVHGNFRKGKITLKFKRNDISGSYYRASCFKSLNSVLLTLRQKKTEGIVPFGDKIKVASR